MANITIWSPLLDLKTADGGMVPAAQAVVGSPEERERALAALQADIGQQIAQQLRDIFATGAVVNPSFRVFASHGLFVHFAPEGTTNAVPEEQVEIPKLPSPVCHKCRAHASGFTIKMCCAQCSEAERRQIKPVSH